jgi:hypothetical protein
MMYTWVTETANRLGSIRYDKDRNEQIQIVCLGPNVCHWVRKFSNNLFMTFLLVKRVEIWDHLELRGDATRHIVLCEGIAMRVELPQRAWVVSSTLWGSVACPRSETLE